MTEMQRGALAQEWRRDWRVASAVTIIVAFSFQTFQTSFSLFVMPLQRDFGWTRGEIGFTHNAYLGAAIASLLIGRAVDRWGPRAIVLTGMSVTVAAYLSLAAMNGSLLLFYALYMVLAVSGTVQSGVTCSRIISATFIRSRGFTLGVTRSGIGLVGAALPILLLSLITLFSWRAAFAATAAMVAAFAFPAAYFWVGGSGKGGAVAPVPRVVPPSYRSLLSNWRVIVLCVAAALGYSPTAAVLTQLQPLLVGKGVAPGTAAGLIGLTGLASLVGAIGSGLLIDRFWAPAMAVLIGCAAAAGLCLLAFSATLDTPTAAAAIVLMGVGLGAEVDILAFLVARYFGIPAFSTIYGMAVFSIAILASAAASLLGAAFDRFGSYDQALVLIAGCVVVSGFMYLTLGRYPVIASERAAGGDRYDLGAESSRDDR